MTNRETQHHRRVFRVEGSAQSPDDWCLIASLVAPCFRQGKRSAMLPSRLDDATTRSADWPSAVLQWPHFCFHVDGTVAMHTGLSPSKISESPIFLRPPPPYSKKALADCIHELDNIVSRRLSGDHGSTMSKNTPKTSNAFKATIQNLSPRGARTRCVYLKVVVLLGRRCKLMPVVCGWLSCW